MHCQRFAIATDLGCLSVEPIRVTELLYKTSAVAEMGDRLATIDMSRKVGGGGLLCPFPGGMGPHLTQRRLGRGLPPYQVAS